ncbi:MAG TPA: hypothetical protein VFD04_15250 [Actinomycetes bacterium]|jgi:hydroxypyruvate isomerase|nr:hypothetical protein [Actinomycetes bacterium]
MLDHRPATDHEAAERARAWLDGRHARERELVVLLLRHAPEADVARALDRLPDAELHDLACQLAEATDLRQVARGILGDLDR